MVDFQSSQEKRRAKSLGNKVAALKASHNVPAQSKELSYPKKTLAANGKQPVAGFKPKYSKHIHDDDLDAPPASVLVDAIAQNAITEGAPKGKKKDDRKRVDWREVTSSRFFGVGQLRMTFDGKMYTGSAQVFSHKEEG